MCSDHVAAAATTATADVARLRARASAVCLFVCLCTGREHSGALSCLPCLMPGHTATLTHKDEEGVSHTKVFAQVEGRILNRAQ